MEVTKHQLQQQIEFAKGIMDILKRNEDAVPEERKADYGQAEAYCELVIKSCELAAELLGIEAAAKKQQAAADEPADEPAEKPKRQLKKKKKESVQEPDASDDLDDLF